MAATVARFNQLVKVVSILNTNTIDINSDSIDVAVLSELSQTTTINNPTGSPKDGQLLTIRITSTISQVLIFNTKYIAASNLLLPSNTTGNNTEDHFTFRYNISSDKWTLISNTIQLSSSNNVSPIWRKFSHDFGIKPLSSGNFIVTTNQLTIGKEVLISLATGLNNNIDDLEWDNIIANGIATSSTTFKCFWNCSTLISGIKTFNYLQI